MKTSLDSAPLCLQNVPELGDITKPLAQDILKSTLEAYSIGVQTGVASWHTKYCNPASSACQTATDYLSGAVFLCADVVSSLSVFP